MHFNPYPTYFKIKEFEVETDIGIFLCKAYKEKCNNRIIIRGKQVSIKIGSKNILIDENNKTFTFYKFNNKCKIIEINKNSATVDPSGTITTEEVELKRTGYSFYIVPHTLLKYDFMNFEMRLKEKYKERLI